MTSQRFSERTIRTERTDFSPSLSSSSSPSPRRSPSTVRRGLKKRGVLPSFGDMILPIVGVFAVVLLVIFGRQFFLNGMNSSPGIASTRAYAEAPAILAELERKAEPELPPVGSPPVAKNPDSASSSQEIANNAKNNDENLLAVAVAVPAQTQTQTKAQTQTSTKTQTQAKAQTSSKPAAPAAAKKTGTSSVSDKQWRVQVGAYTTRAGAQDAANKIKKAGYNAVVYSNPASKHFKVWVAGGADKKAADNVVSAMQKLGYKGSFSFPPAK